MRCLIGCLDAVVASIARLLAALALVNLGLELAWFGAPRSWLWIGLHGVPVWFAGAWLVVFAGSVLGWSHLPHRGRLAARVIVATAAALCVRDAVCFWIALAGGELRSSIPIPVSAGIAAALGRWAARPPRHRGRHGGAAWWRRLGNRLLDAVVAVAGLLVAMVAFGASDYRRPVDAIVVFGAGVRRDGSASNTLRDRTVTACVLWRAGLAEHLVLSGGVGDGAPNSEARAAAAVAGRLGVPDAAIVLDDSGFNTRATIATCARLADERGWRTFAMVSHDYHLARIKLLARRAGIVAFTVPAPAAAPPERGAWLRTRELAAWLAYYWAR